MFQLHPDGLMGQRDRREETSGRDRACVPQLPSLQTVSQEEYFTPDPGPYGVGLGHTGSLGCVRELQTFLKNTVRLKLVLRAWQSPEHSLKPKGGFG